MRKADYSRIYNEPEPRSYHRVLGVSDYQTPDHAQRVFRRLLEAQRAADGRLPGVFDLCCSYGIVGALLRCDLTWSDLRARYEDRALDHLPAAELIAADRDWYAERRRGDAPGVAGLDVAARAVAYGELTGLLEPGVVENLEQQDPSDAVAEAVDGVGLVTVSGGVSYITERTIGRMLKLFDRPPWIATFVLRTYDYELFSEVCAGHGLMTERLDGVTFRQRRFVSDGERGSALDQISARGRDASLEAEDGYYHTELFVSRPAEEAARQSLGELLGDVVAARVPWGQHEPRA